MNSELDVHPLLKPAWFSKALKVLAIVPLLASVLAAPAAPATADQPADAPTALRFLSAVVPSYIWHTFYGSGGYQAMDTGYGVAVDGSGNVYIAGYSYVAWLGDGNTAPLHPHSAGNNSDIVVVKLASNGAYLWHTFYGSTNTDRGLAITVDGSGGVYVAGHSWASWQGDSGQNPLHPYRYGNNDIVILKLNGDGAYQWHAFYGGGGEDSGYGIATDSNGNVYFAGSSGGGWDENSEIDPLHPHSDELVDFVVLSLTSNGVYRWHTFYGSADFDYGYNLAVDGSGNIYVTGHSWSSWQGSGGQNPRHPHSASEWFDIVVLKLNSSGAYQWHTFYGSDAGNGCAEYGRDIALDGNGNVYVTGRSCTTWQGDGNHGPLHAHSGIDDLVVLKLTSSGAYQWHTFYGDSLAIDGGQGIAVEGSGVYVTGESVATWQGDGDTAPLHPYSADGDIVALKLSSDGAYRWHTFYGTDGDDLGNDVATDANGGIYVAGDSRATWQGDGGADPLHPFSGDVEMAVLKLQAVELGDYAAKSAKPFLPRSGDTITYTITLRNPGPALASVRVTDTLPVEVDYAGNLWASSGSCGAASGVITWTGTVSATMPVTITFGATVSIAASQFITNTAWIDDGAGNVWQRQAVVIANGYSLYLPLILQK